jgi:AraC-like DNA-binding protein
MESVLVFAERNSRPFYASLSLPTVSVTFAPVNPAAFTFTATDMELAIIDCGHKAKAGLATLGEIKRQRPDVPVIFVTAVHSEELVLRAFKLGAREYFRRPFLQQELATAVVKLLGFKRQAPQPGHRSATNLLPPKTATFAHGLPERLRRAVEHLEQNLTEPFSLEALAGRACLSKYHFCRLFKQHAGLSPKQFCICRRIEKARELLVKHDLTVSQIAYRLGFNDASEFIRQFKKFTGHTPRRYRNACSTGSFAN